MWPLCFAHLTLAVCVALFRALGAQRDCEITDVLWNHWHAQNSTRPWATWFKAPVSNLTLDQMTSKHSNGPRCPCHWLMMPLPLTYEWRHVGASLRYPHLKVQKEIFSAAKYEGWWRFWHKNAINEKKWWCLEHLRCRYQAPVDCTLCKGLDSTQVTFKAIQRGQREVSCSLFIWCLCSACLPWEGYQLKKVESSSCKAQAH